MTTLKEVPWDESIQKAPFIYKTEFMACEHNYLCSVCITNSAVMNMNTGILEPCWKCQKKGYRTVKLGRFLAWLLRETYTNDLGDEF